MADPRPLTIALRAISNMSTAIAQVMGMHEGVRIDWHPDTKSWSCTEAVPRVWFAEAFLNVLGVATRTPINPADPWHIADGYVRLIVANGTWVWRLTENAVDEADPFGEPMTKREGVWPD